MLAGNLNEVQRIVVVVCVATGTVQRLVLEEEVEAAGVLIGATLVHRDVARALCLYVQELRPVVTLVSTVIELEVRMVSSRDGVEDVVLLACYRLALIIEDVLVVLAALRELAVVPLCAEVEVERLAIIVAGVGGRIEAALTSLADGAEERAIVHLDNLGFVASLNHGDIAEVPRLTAVS